MRALIVLHARGEAIRGRAEREVAARLADASPTGLASAAEAACAAADREAARELERSGAAAPACSAGCSYCCHVHVDATVPEILAVAAHIARTRSSEAIHALTGSLARRANEVSTMTDEARWAARIPCALLAGDGLCSIHPARPLRCRAFNALSVDPCRAAFEGRPGDDPSPHGPLARAYDAAEEGYERALDRAGVSAVAHRLEAGLLLALTDPSAAAGEPDAFVSSRSPGSSRGAAGR